MRIAGRALAVLLLSTWVAVLAMADAPTQKCGEFDTDMRRF
jgi:hypothetical protein